jgi:hypothetical protein
MHSTLPSKPADDPCDVVIVEPDAVRVAPSDEELSDVLHQAARYRSDNKTSAGSEFTASPTAPPVDTTFRPTSVHAVAGMDKRKPMARRAARAFMTLLLAVCMGLTAIGWKSYGEMAKRKIAKLATQVVLATSMPSEASEPGAQPAAAPAIQTSEANTASPQSPAVAPATPKAVAPTDVPSAQSAQLLQSMARDVASLGQEVEQLKASVEQLKTGQQQTSSHVANRSEQQNRRTRTSVPSPRSAVARSRRPMASYSSPPIAAAPALPQSAPYYAPSPSRAQQQTTAGFPTEPELSPVPRPPMPVR